MAKSDNFLDYQLRNIFRDRVRPKTGDMFGVELEMEGRYVVTNRDGVPHVAGGWTQHQDGSLRNNHGQSVEYVFNGPASYNNSVKRINNLFDVLTKGGAKQVLSNRTSTHIHYNMGDKKVYQLVNLFVLYTLFEEVLGNYSGEERNGNVFCLNGRHAYHTIQLFYEAIMIQKGFGNFGEDQRYAGLNVAALNKFGTVEFRTMRGLDNAADVVKWLSILNDLTQFACYTMTTPADTIRNISMEGPVDYFRKVFSPENFEALTAGVSHDAIATSVYEGIRLTQMLAFRSEELFNSVVRQGPDFWAKQNKKAEVEEDLEVPFEDEEPLADRLRRVIGQYERGEVARENNPAGEVPGRIVWNHNRMEPGVAPPPPPPPPNLWQMLGSYPTRAQAEEAFPHMWRGNPGYRITIGNDPDYPYEIQRRIQT